MWKTNEYIPDGDLDKIMRHLHGQDRLIANILIDTGFRVDDLLSARWYNYKNGYLTLKEHKTGKLRSKPCEIPTPSYYNQLSYIFQARRPLDGQRHKLHRTTFWRVFKRAVKLSGLQDKGYTVHSLRKVYAVRLYRSCYDPVKVQEDLNHSNVTTTLLYILGAFQASV